MSVKVIGAGFGRTGTASFKAALELLGFGPCYHMFELMEHPEHLPYWKEARDGTLENWESIMAGYGSTSDWPACNFYEPLMRAYPDAKVVLTIRDPEKWYESVASTIYTFGKRPHDVVDPDRDARTAFNEGLIWQGTFGGRFPDKAHALDVFRQHVETVKQKVPADRLLTFDVQEGWEPLCAFLDVPIPDDQPFPRLNDRQAILERFHAAPPTDQP